MVAPLFLCSSSHQLRNEEKHGRSAALAILLRIPIIALGPRTRDSDFSAAGPPATTRSTSTSTSTAHCTRGSGRAPISYDLCAALASSESRCTARTSDDDRPPTFARVLGCFGLDAHSHTSHLAPSDPRHLRTITRASAALHAPPSPHRTVLASVLRAI
ncbi:hypothetical protein B0H12DRAFT_1147902 [Mycena haematopus]|nr:hypothetical protein B0H12DRAFT_1147902 [Mycena haematopus]